MEWSPGKPASPKGTLKTPKSPSTSLADRRVEERFSVEASVELRFEDPISRTIEGSLMDYSKNGFRANHQFFSLHAGQLIEFRHLFGEGRARVMWNRISPEGVETGFLVLAEP